MLVLKIWQFKLSTIRVLFTKCWSDNLPRITLVSTSSSWSAEYGFDSLEAERDIRVCVEWYQAMGLQIHLLRSWALISSPNLLSAGAFECFKQRGLLIFERLPVMISDRIGDDLPYQWYSATPGNSHAIIRSTGFTEPIRIRIRVRVRNQGFTTANRQVCHQ